MKPFRDLTHDDMQTPRYVRAMRFVDTLEYLMRDFLPTDRHVRRRFRDVMLEMGWELNAELIHVPEVWDALNKAQLEQALVESHGMLQKSGKGFMVFPSV